MSIPNNIQEDFSREPLSLHDLAAQPMDQFKQWFREACEENPDAPNAVSLATASADAVPSVRTVLMKQFDQNGFVFFTNYASRKGQDLAENPKAAILFPWTSQGRQIIARGAICRLPHDESSAYFDSRSRGSQVGAWASHQSKVISDRSVLEDKLFQLTQQFAEEKIQNTGFLGWLSTHP
jgi:Pyridoxamine-phosphate oxidase